MSNRYLYWTNETHDSPWNLITDTEENKKRAIDSGAKFLTWASLSAPYQGNGQPEPNRWGDLPADFDDRNIKTALDQLRILTLSFLPSAYDIDPHEIKFFLSGGKGFHAVIPAHLLNAQDGDPRLPLIYKLIVSGWKEKLNLTSLDLSLYNMKKGKMFRIPNVKRTNGRYKVPLTLNEVMLADAEELVRLGSEPRILETD